MRKLLLGLRDGAEGGIEEDRARGGGALVNGEDMGHSSGLRFGVSTVDKRRVSRDFNKLVLGVQDLSTSGLLRITGVWRKNFRIFLANVFEEI